jgi:hypothetical protein
MDTKLLLDKYNQEYKDIWLHYFDTISNNKNIDEVDKIEDCLIEVIQAGIKSDDAFFINALDTGTLPQEWLEKVIRLVSEPALPKGDSEDDLKKSALSHAITEKPMGVKHKRLSTTRRANPKLTPTLKKSLAKTRRNR